MGREEVLTEGKCDLCEKTAQIPWKNHKFCYNCFKSFWSQLTMDKGVYNEPENTKAEETREEAIQKSIKQKEKNGIRRPGSFYRNLNF
jgi:hypothetical protein